MGAVVSLDRERRIRALVSVLKADLSQNPELAERFRAAERGELAIPDLQEREENMPPNDSSVMIRLPAALLERADALQPRIEASEYGAFMGSAVTRSAVLRLALVKGLAQLEQEHPPKRRSRRK